MRELSILALALLSCGGAALAQVATERPLAAQMYDRRPTAEDFVRTYPGRALDNELPGRVVLCCTAKADHRLDCGVLFEWPANMGFGAAATKVAEAFRLTDTGYGYYRDHPREGIKLPINYTVVPLSNANQRADKIVEERISKIPEDVCTLPAPNS